MTSSQIIFFADLLYFFITICFFLNIKKIEHGFIFLVIMECCLFIEEIFNTSTTLNSLFPVGLLFAPFLVKMDDIALDKRLSKISKRYILMPYVILSMINITVFTLNTYFAFNLKLCGTFTSLIGSLLILCTCLYLHREGFKKSDNRKRNTLNIQMSFCLFWYGVFNVFFVIFGRSVMRNFGIDTDFLVQLTLIPLILIFSKQIISFNNRANEYDNSEDLTYQEQPELKMYKSSGLDHDKIEVLANRIETYLLEDKTFLKPDLDLDGFANMIGIPKHHISEVLNTYLNKNFYRLIGEYRIKYAIEIINNNNFKIESIAYDCGFNSTSAFNRYFKEIVGQQPSAYRKNIILNA